jgi:trimeric autotransporter adhesin
MGPGFSLQRKRIGRLVFVGGALGLLALFAIAAAAQACNNPGFDTNGRYGAYDQDGDGYNDSVSVNLVYPGTYPNASAITLNESLEYLNGTPIDSNVSGPAVYSPAFGATIIYATVHMGASDVQGTVVLRATMDEGAGACDWNNTTYFLYPPGRYEPTLSTSTGPLQVDEGAAVTYAVRVGSLGNLPDIINLTASSSLGWSVSVSPDNVTLDPGASTVVNVTVRAAHNAAPLAVDSTTVTAASYRIPASNATLVLTTTVNAQVFLPQLSSSAPSQTAPPGTVATFTITLRNGGNNHDVIAVTATSAPTGWAVGPWLASFALDAGALATLTINITVPVTLAGLLVWSPTFTARSSDGATTGTLVIEAHLELPDYLVAPGDISVSQAHPLVGASVPVTVTVHNAGLQLAVDVTVSLSDGSTNQTVTVTVAAVTGTAVATFAWTALPGSSTLTATADSSHSLPEANEANNAASVTVVADAPPTAAVGSAAVSAHPGEAVTISAAGSTDADGTVAAYRFDFGDGADSDWMTTSSVQHTYAAAGTYIVKVRVRDNNGAESQNVTATVTVAAKPSTPGFEGGLAIAAVAAVAAGIGARGARRKGTT